MIIKHAIHRVGNISKNRRIWIANKDITNSFDIGDCVFISYCSIKKEISVEKGDILSNHSISSRKNKNGKTPILDIKNKDVTKLFRDIEKVEVLYYPNKIIIRSTKNEKLRSERLDKKGLKTFELFCGGGTLSYFFKKAGFVNGGGLEKIGKYLDVFEKNATDEVHTILGSLEDVHSSDYPKDIDIVLSGIPCTDFTNANTALKTAIKTQKSGGTLSEKQRNLLEKKGDSDAITFHVLNAIRAMNPRVVVIEEVPEYSNSESANLLRTILSQMGYKISETIDTGTIANRKRWVLIASLKNSISLTSLVPKNRETIDKVLSTPIEDRDWRNLEAFPFLVGAKSKPSVGGRDKNPTKIYKVNTFDTHGNRYTEPALRHPTLKLYDRYYNNDIIDIHGLQGFQLSGVKTVDRQILGQGCTDMFYFVAKRVKESILKQEDLIT